MCLSHIDSSPLCLSPSLPLCPKINRGFGGDILGDALRAETPTASWSEATCPAWADMPIAAVCADSSCTDENFQG